MKTISNLILALSFLGISNGGAATIVTGISQELYALAHACNGTDCGDDGPYTVTGPLPSSLSDSAYATTAEGDTVASFFDPKITLITMGQGSHNQFAR
jgi:hypothetical protein